MQMAWSPSLQDRLETVWREGPGASVALEEALGAALSSEANYWLAVV